MKKPLFKPKRQFPWLKKGWGMSALLGGSACAGVVLAVAMVQLWMPLSMQSSVPVRTQWITIPMGTSIHSLSKELFEKQLIASPSWFRFYARVFGLHRKIKAGYMPLNPSMSLFRILRILGQDEMSNAMIRVTFPEGLNLAQMGHILETKKIVSQAEFCHFVQRAKPIFVKKYPFLERCPTDNLEGFLFPDTYFVAQGIDVGAFVDMCLHQFERKMIPIWAQSEGKIKQKYGFYQVLIMASLLEKEAQHAEELPVIASVFYNRLSIGMRLASDPTVIYAMGLSTKPQVTYRDLKVKSEYNTYQNTGLPPTPIASPGEKAFFAALNPEETSFLFFVADGKGGHYFTHSYKDHLAVQNR
jgi:UPF0755 protein